jgi:hypothetical protein
MEIPISADADRDGLRLGLVVGSAAAGIHKEQGSR